MTCDNTLALPKLNVVDCASKHASAHFIQNDIEERAFS